MTVFRATLTGIRWGKVTMQNVLHFEDVSSTMTDEQVMIELRDNWCTLWRPIQSNTFGWRNISVFRTGSSITPSNFPVVVNGTDGVDNIGGQNVTTLKVRINTFFAGKQGRGRFYLPGVRDQYLEFGEYIAAAMTTFNTVVQLVKTRYQSVGGVGPLQLGVRGRGSNAEFHPMSNLTIGSVPGIQRRRNVGVGL
jgi:hypothetical protein